MRNKECSCRLCEIAHKFNQVVKKLQSEKDQKFLTFLLMSMCNAELDRDWTQCKLDEAYSFIKSIKNEKEFKEWLKKRN